MGDVILHLSVYEFFIENSLIEEFQGKRVLEVGPGNASVRPFVERFLRPKEYIGVDITHGKYVDLIVPAEKLRARVYRTESSNTVVITVYRSFRINKYLTHAQRL